MKSCEEFRRSVFEKAALRIQNRRNLWRHTGTMATAIAVCLILYGTLCHQWAIPVSCTATYGYHDAVVGEHRVSLTTDTISASHLAETGILRADAYLRDSDVALLYHYFAQLETRQAEGMPIEDQSWTFTVTFHLACGETKKYTLYGDRYICLDVGPWREIVYAPEPLSDLLKRLDPMEIDKAMLDE